MIHGRGQDLRPFNTSAYFAWWTLSIVCETFHEDNTSKEHVIGRPGATAPVVRASKECDLRTLLTRTTVPRSRHWD
jgi:hypothetical protein